MKRLKIILIAALILHVLNFVVACAPSSDSKTDPNAMPSELIGNWAFDTTECKNSMGALYSIPRSFDQVVKINDKYWTMDASTSLNGPKQMVAEGWDYGELKAEFKKSMNIQSFEKYNETVLLKYKNANGYDCTRTYKSL